MAEKLTNIQENDSEYMRLDQLYEECINYLQTAKNRYQELTQQDNEGIYDNVTEERKPLVQETIDESDDLAKNIEIKNQYSRTVSEQTVPKKEIISDDANVITQINDSVQEIIHLDQTINNIKKQSNKTENAIALPYEVNLPETPRKYETANNRNKITDIELKLINIKEAIEPKLENFNHINQNDVKADEVLITISDEITTDDVVTTDDVANPKSLDPIYEAINYETKPIYSIENEKPTQELKSERLRRLSEQLPRIIITQSNTSLEKKTSKKLKDDIVPIYDVNKNHVSSKYDNSSRSSSCRYRSPYIEYPKRLVSKHGVENVALISNVPYGKLRLLNDTFHTLINLRWRWIVTGTVVVHFTIWLVFAVFWYIASLAHYDFDPDPPQKACITGGKDFVTIFLASVEAQTTIGFGDRTIDEECPESIFLFIMQLILGTGLSGVLTCVVYAKLTRPEKLSRDGVGFSKKAVICMRDGKLCLMLRAWDLNYDHLISSDFSAHFVKTYRTKEGEYIRYYARSLELQQRQFLLWPVTVVHVIDDTSPLYNMSPENFINLSYEITISLKGASASMGTYTQSQTSYLPREVLWGYRFPSVVKYNHRKQKYVIDRKKLDRIEQVDTPLCSANQLYSSVTEKEESTPWCPGTPSSFSERVSEFKLEKSSSFRRKHHKA